MSEAWPFVVAAVLAWAGALAVLARPLHWMLLAMVPCAAWVTGGLIPGARRPE